MSGMVTSAVGPVGREETPRMRQNPVSFVVTAIVAICKPCPNIAPETVFSSIPVRDCHFRPAGNVIGCPSEVISGGETLVGENVEAPGKEEGANVKTVIIPCAKV